MRLLLILSLLAAGPAFAAAPVTITLDAPAYAGRQVLLYRYMDPFTLRLERIATGRADAKGHVELTAQVEGTERALLRIGKVGADLFLRAGRYHVQMPPPNKHEARSISGNTRVDLTFPELAPLDVNALVSDLNTRLDAFLAEDLATDQDAGMEAVAKARSGSATMVPDTARKQQDLFLSPRWNEARVDTFARKLHKFYASVEDPWFQQDVEYGIAGLRLGPRTNDRDLFNRYLKGKPVLYDVPEYTRFFSAFFEDHLLRFPFRTDTEALIKDIRLARTDSLKAMLAKNDFLKDPRVNELVLITGLYAQQANKQFDHAGILKVLEQVRDGSIWPEHRHIAGNMLWDLTAMKAGATMPAIEVIDTTGNAAMLKDFTGKPVCLLVSTFGDRYGEQELAAMEKLHAAYGPYARFITIILDRTPIELAAWLRAHPQRNWEWFTPADQPLFLDALRIRSVPTLFMLKDKVITASPGPLPSEGLPEVLHQLKVKDDADRQLRPDRGVPPPKR